jgi:putative ABC transport system permease protein
MLKKFINSFVIGFKNIKSHFLHTLLSILGVVIGVAALVGILSLIDSMENYVHKQISATTDIEKIAIVTQKQKQIAGSWVRKEHYGYFDYEKFAKLKSELSLPFRRGMISFRTGDKLVVKEQSDSIETVMTATAALAGYMPDSAIVSGRLYTEQDLVQQNKIIVVNESFAKKIAKNESIEKALGKHILHNDNELEIVGITKNKQENANIFIPMTLFSEQVIRENAPTVEIEAHQVTQVAPLKKEIEGWLKKNSQNQGEDFQVIISEFRAKQATQGFLLAKVIGGLIVGISVLVGGIGIMNVLLISVTERTMEIGIQKAVGAQKMDIIFQFLSESLCISFIGSGLGLILGVLGTWAVTPLVEMLLPEVSDFQAHFTWGTLLVVGTVAMIIGIAFGTYPAMKAANLDPVEAIRRE